MFVKIRFTYDVVTEESAQHGDTAKRGWYIPGMGKFAEDDASASEHIVCTAKQAVEEIQRTVGSIDSISDNRNGATFYPADSEQDYQTGDYTSYHAHVECDPRLLRAIIKALGE